MRKFLTVLVFAILLVSRCIADEGMWLPILLAEGPEADMKRLGMKISAEDIFSLNKPSIKDAICLFGGGCTAEIVSSKGLIFTNHHCGYSAIQSHSSVEMDYLTNGFWARTLEEELPNPKLKVSILTYMEDVTARVLKNIDNNTSPEQKKIMIEAAIAEIIKEYAKDKNSEASVKPFFYGNQYILIVSRVFRDVRLVGAPPSSIGKFGGDTDNWMWPRHTGDFCVFRIYADKNNNPANYSKDNVPYNPAYHLTISLKGVQEGDFTFVYGYPGTTNEYLYSKAVDRIANYENPVAIKIRGKKLEVYRKYMEQSKKTRIQYSAKYATVENFYKKMIGESNGVKRTNIIARKQELEKQFDQWVQENTQRKNKYGNLMSKFEEVYSKYAPYNLAFEYLIEAGLGLEIVRFAYSFEDLVSISKNKNKNDSEISNAINKLKTTAEGFYKNYDSRIDKELMGILLKIYYEAPDKSLIPQEILTAGEKYKGDFAKYADDVFNRSIFSDEKKLMDFLAKYKPSMAKQIENDPAYKLSLSIYSFYFQQLKIKIEEFETATQSLYELYMQGLMEMQPDKKFYPDANSTLRVAYGQVKGYYPRDAVYYRHYTTLKGMIEKEDSTVYDYVVDEKIKKLYEEKDFGDYADKDGTMHIAFIATNHTTGGNSGSPVLNAEGHLIGINFDRVWEGTMSDIVYEPDMCRNISVDIRYCLFIIDKYAGAKHLIDELTIIK